MTKNKASPKEITLIKWILRIMIIILIVGLSYVFAFSIDPVKAGASLIMAAIVGIFFNIGNSLGWLANIITVLPFANKIVHVIKYLLDLIVRPSDSSLIEFFVIYHKDWNTRSQDIIANIIKPALEEPSEYQRTYNCVVKPDPWRMEEDLLFKIDNAGSAPHTHIFFVLSNKFLIEIDESEHYWKLTRGTLIQKMISVANRKDPDRKGTAVFVERTGREKELGEQGLAFVIIDVGQSEAAKETIANSPPRAYRHYKQTPNSPPPGSTGAGQNLANPPITASAPITTLTQTTLLPLAKEIWEAPERNPNFINRDDQNNLSSIAGRLTTRADFLVLYGLNGIGKTEIARAYAFENGTRSQQYPQNYLYHWTLWLDASEGLEDGCRKLNGQLYRYYSEPTVHVDVNQTGNQELIKLRKWLQTYENQLPPGKRWLLIVDKCEWKDFEEKAKDELQNFIRGHIIYTLRKDPGVGYYVPQRVDGMNEKDSTDLLIQSTGRRIITEPERNKAKRVVEALGYNPLAIVNAGVYISIGITFEGFLQQYNTQKTQLLTRSFEKGTRELFIGAGQLEVSVATTFQLSFGAVEDDKFGANEYLLLCANLELKDIPIEIVKAMPLRKGSPSFPLNSQMLHDALAILYKLLFISGEQDKAIRLETIVRDVIRAGAYPLHELEKKWYRDATVEAVSIAFQQALFGKGPQGYLRLIRRLGCAELGDLYLPHVFECYMQHIKQMKAAHTVTLGAIQLMHVAGEYLLEYPQYEKTYLLSAKELLEEARSLREQAVVDMQNQQVADTAYPDLPTCCNSLGELYHERLQNGEVQYLEDAKALYKKALSILATPNRTPSDHRNVDEAIVRNNLGRLLDDTVGYEKVQEEFSAALTKRDEVLATVTEPMGKIALLLNKAAILNNLAGTYVKSGAAKLETANTFDNQHRHIEAEKIRHKAYSDFEVAEMRFNEALQVLMVVKNLLPRQLDTALSLEKACGWQRKLYEEQVHANMATLYVCWGGVERYTQVDSLYRNAIDVLEGLKGQAQQQQETRYEIEIYLQLAMQHNNLAELHRIQQPFNKAKAKECYEKAHHNYNSYTEAKAVDQEVVFERIHRMRFVIRDNDDELRYTSRVMNKAERNNYEVYRKLYLDI